MLQSAVAQQSLPVFYVQWFYLLILSRKKSHKVPIKGINEEIASFCFVLCCNELTCVPCLGSRRTLLLLCKGRESKMQEDNYHPKT